MQYTAINLAPKFGLFDRQWQPSVIAEMNDYQFKLVTLQGDLVWHAHKDTNETFMCGPDLPSRQSVGVRTWVS
jgi:hypothetical protein